MSKILTNIQVQLDEDLEQRIKSEVPNYQFFHILKESVDARKRHSAHFVYTIEVFEKGEEPPPNNFKLQKVKSFEENPVAIVGSGPAGLFAAIRLVERGIPCVIFERGSDCITRLKSINKFWREGVLNPNDNVCFGEGGAGLYSDGKLITRIKSPHISYVMDKLIQFGAPKEIRYLSNPHVGSDRIRRIIPVIRNFLTENGVKFYFNKQVKNFDFLNNQIVGFHTIDNAYYKCNRLILATGHSAEDIFHELVRANVHIEGKSFAIGLRIEHPQLDINKIQYRENYNHPKLGSANYKLVAHNKTLNQGVYSFCMCPGGYILSSGTEADRIVCNGMSNYRRNSKFANSAIVVSVDYNKMFGQDINAGILWREQIEKMAFQEVQSKGGTKELPVQTVNGFLNGKISASLESSCPSGVTSVNFHDILPKETIEGLTWGLKQFEKSMKGFVSEVAQFHGVETRTSCPWRIPRDPITLQSTSHIGLYPAGEGAGYAGGITSAACDGIKIADAIAHHIDQTIEVD